MIVRSTSGTLFSNAGQSIEASTNPQLKCHFPTNSAELTHCMCELLYPHGISPIAQVHLSILKSALNIDNNIVLFGLGLTHDNQHFQITFCVDALNQPFLYAPALSKITGHSHIDATISIPNQENLSFVSLLYPKNAVPHFLEWLENKVKALDEDELGSLRDISKNDDNLQTYKPSFANHTKRMLLKLERQLIIEGDKDLLVGQLLTTRASLIPAIRRLEEHREHDIQDEQETNIARLMESFKLAINVISTEEALEKKDIAKQLLREVDEFCTVLQEQIEQAGNTETKSPTMLVQ